MAMMLHSGGHRVDLTKVLEVKTPAATDTWDPMSHGDVIDLIHREIPNYGMEVINWEHALRNNGKQYFGIVSVRDTQNRDLEVSGTGLQIGIRNSINKTLAAALVAGSKVFVCDNLAFSGEVALSRKHTAGIRSDIHSKIGNAFQKLLGLFGKQKQQIELFKTMEISDMEKDRLITLVMRNKVLPPSRFERLEKQFKSDDPTACGGIKEPTMWRFMNGVTQVLKNDHPDAIVDRTGRLFEMCNKFVPFNRLSITV